MTLCMHVISMRWRIHSEVHKSVVHTWDWTSSENAIRWLLNFFLEKYEIWTLNTHHQTSKYWHFGEELDFTLLSDCIQNSWKSTKKDECVWKSWEKINIHTENKFNAGWICFGNIFSSVSKVMERRQTFHTRRPMNVRHPTVKVHFYVKHLAKEYFCFLTPKLFHEINKTSIFHIWMCSLTWAMNTFGWFHSGLIHAWKLNLQLRWIGFKLFFFSGQMFIHLTKNKSWVSNKF